MKTVLRFGRGVLILVLVLSLTTALGSGKPVTARETLLASDLRISQVYGGGGGSGYYLYDYVELFNAGAASVDLTGWSLQYGSATGNFASVATNLYAFPAGTTITPGQYFLVQLGAAGTSGLSLPVTPDLTTTNLAMGQANGKVALANIATALGCGATATPCTLPHSNIVDLAAWGTSNNAEGGVTINSGTSLTNQQGGVRKSSGCQDTDNNGNDFDVLSGAELLPRNSASPTHSCMVSQPAIVLTKTVGTDPLACATTEAVSLPFGGGEVTYCYLVENTGDVALALHDLEDSELGTILNDFSYTLAPDASAFITQTAMVTVTTVNSALWTAFNAGPTDVVTATDVATVTVELPVPAIVLTKTVGTTPGVCATTDDISVAEGTTVYYCYQVENIGNVTFDYHDLVDNRLGTILDGSAYALAPGALYPQVIVSATLSATTVNTATWAAYTTVGGPAASAMDTARVVVTPSAISVTELQASAAGGWSSVALLGALALGGVVWRRRRGWSSIKSM